MMLLMRLRAIVREQGEATLQELARILDVAPEAVEAMLNHWISRGCIEKRESPCAGKGCTCACAAQASYVWVKKPSRV